MCGTVTRADEGRRVILAGWVNHRRDHGGLTFLDLRDHTGLVQLVFNPTHSGEAQRVAERARLEWVLRVEGTVGRRPPATRTPICRLARSR